jgi:hypothetical protein
MHPDRRQSSDMSQQNELVMHLPGPVGQPQLLKWQNVATGGPFVVVQECMCTHTWECVRIQEEPPVATCMHLYAHACVRMCTPAYGCRCLGRGEQPGGGGDCWNRNGGYSAELVGQYPVPVRPCVALPAILSTCRPRESAVHPKPLLAAERPCWSLRLLMPSDLKSAEEPSKR